MRLKMILAVILAMFMSLMASVDAFAATYAPFAKTPYRMIISHRGGPLKYPEMGYRGFNASLASGFALEADARQLKDGLWVLNHDETVDRTIRGISGRVDQITRDQWFNKAYLKPGPSNKYFYDRPSTLGGFFLRYGGKAPILLEHKSGSVPSFIWMITSRNLQASVIPQTFNWNNAKQFKASGLNPMFLMGKEFPVSPATIKSAGIKYVGVSKDMGPWHVKQLKNAGLIVMSYTVNTKSNFNYEVNQGVNGSFSDNPWALR